MITNQQQLAAQLKEKLASFYLITGDEVQLLDDSCQMIESHAQKDGDLERLSFIIDPYFDEKHLWQSISQTSLFNKKRLLKCHLIDLKFADKFIAYLSKMTQTQTADLIVLLVVYAKNHKNLNPKLYNWFKQHGIVIQMNQLRHYQLPQWIKLRMQSHGLKANSEAIQVLAECVEGNLLAAAQAIEKLSLLYGSGEITAKQVIHCLTVQSRYDVFQLTDSTLAGKTDRLIHILHTLKQESVEPSIILWAICRDLRLFITLSYLCQHQSMEQALKTEQIWPWRKKLIENTLMKHSIDTFRYFLQYAMQIDAMIKGHEKGNVWDGLQRLCLSLAGCHKFVEIKA